MDYLPIFLQVAGARCLLVGGGEVAARKSRLLRRAGARLVVVAPELGETLAALVDGGGAEWHARRYHRDDLDGATLVVAATSDRAVNASVSADCRARRIPVNVVDDQPLCSFIMPSLVDRSPLIIAISTGGNAPVLARLVRERLESTLPAALGVLARLAGEFRAAVKRRLAGINARRAFWESLLDGPVAELVYAGRQDDARAAIDAALARSSDTPPPGEVYLVGAGPGDPDLLTFRALRLMQRADVVLYDRLVSDAVLELVRRDAKRVYVGKRRGDHALRQHEINAALVAHARQGLKVLRLKGGDPFIFGRGGEEIDSLASEGIAFQVVPGITAASGCAAFAGIPITHRDHAQACVFVAGHLRDGTVRLNWPALAQPGQTLVFYMGLQGLPIICRELIAHGLEADLPAALVQQGTTPNQVIFTGTLATLPSLIARSDPRPPTLLIVGSVVSLHEKLSWFRPGAGTSANAAVRDAARLSAAPSE